MNPRVAKDLKTIGPGFILSLAACLIPILFDARGVLVEMALAAAPILFVFGCVFMGADIFGIEFDRGTLPMLLSQPLARAAIWREKMQTLAGGLGGVTVAGALIFALWASGHVPMGSFLQGHFWIWLGLIPLMAFCTTPFWTLSYRSTLLGIIFTVLVPSVLVTGHLFLKEHLPFLSYSGDAFLLANYGLLAVYSLGCLGLAFRRFQELELVAASGIGSRELTLPKGLERLFEFKTGKKRQAWFVLAKKEFRLHQVNFIAAGLFCTMGIIGGIFYYLHLKSGGARFQFAEPLLIVDLIIYVLLVPLISGAMPVAEEKSWGVKEWQMTLPPSLRLQWTVKIAVALAVSVLLGVVLPLVGVLIGKLILFGVPPGGESSPGGPTGLLVLVCLVHAQLLLTSVVIYAACFARSTVAALVLALIMLFAGVAALRIGFALVPPYDLGRQLTSMLNSHMSLQSIYLFMVATSLAMVFCLVQLFACIAYHREGLQAGGRFAQASILLAVICVLGSFFGRLSAL